MKLKIMLVGAFLVLAALVLAACQTATPAPVEEKPCPTAAPCPACPECPAPPEPVVKEVPFQDAWASSGHNDAEAEAFVHWNEDDPKEVPVGCARCHSTAGYQDYLGADGSAVGVVDAPVPAPGGTIQCTACHSPAAVTLTEVTFPYVGKDEAGADVPTVLSGLGDATRCAVCHQGRASKSAVDAAIEKFGLTEDVDKVSEPSGDPPAALGFINIHYFAAAATLYGTEAKGGYEYDGKSYDARFQHVEGLNTCIGCHNPHTLELNIEKCAECHDGVASVEDVYKIRMISSGTDYDGDGDITESIKSEIEGLQAMLMTAIQAYATEKTGTGIVYDAASHPYFFADADGDGKPDEKEGAKVRYGTWTARLLKAAYNYQVSLKDPGAFAHNGKYIIELLYDSIEDLNTVLSAPVDLSNAHREDFGHFAGSGEAFRHWDAEGEVPGSCAKCHSATGLPTFIKNGVNVAAERADGFLCATCHNTAEWPATYAVKSVTLPSGKAVTFGEEAKDNLCLLCHQGRTAKKNVDAATGVLGDDEVSDKLLFRTVNIHYFAAAVSLFGTEAQGAYEFADKTYLGKNAHTPGFDTCLGCHDPHTQQVKEEACATCHAAAGGDLQKIRMSTVDYDGDGDTTEGMAGEIATMSEKVYAALQAAAEATGTPITYNGAAYPYFFGADGKAFASFTPRLLRAAYNYQIVQKDGGGFAHNGKYLLQILYDTLESLGGDLTGLTRP